MPRQSVKWEDRALIRQFTNIDARVERALTATMAYHATRALAYARQNAPWTDQTGNARNGLFSYSERDSKSHRIVLGGAMPYQIFLETRWSGKYAIIRPTIDHEGPEVMKTVSLLYAKIFRGKG